MDLTGSLVNTSLRIYPSNKCLKYLETLSDVKEAPKNIIKLIKICKPDKIKDDMSKTPANQIELTDEDMKNLHKIKELMIKEESHITKEENDKIDLDKSIESDFKKVPESFAAQSESDGKKSASNVTDKDKDYLTTPDIEWLYTFLQGQRNKGKNVPYLHELLEESNIETPENQVLKRNPTLEARCVKLRAQQEAREYRAMTKGVDNVRIKFPEDSISYQCEYTMF